MPNTGERDYIEVMPENLAEWYMHLVHIASYEFASRMHTGGRVLDYGCGSGYGSKILASSAAQVHAADLSTEAIDYAMNHHAQPNLSFYPLKDFIQHPSTYDLIVSFQVIEHVRDLNTYLASIHRMLTPDGTVLISTPNRLTRLFPFQKPWNIWHLTEYSPDSLRNVLESWFSDIEILHISSVPELTIPELQRTRKLRLIALPATLGIYPEFLRKFLLRIQTESFKLFRSLKSVKKTTHDIGHSPEFPYSSADIYFRNPSEHSTDLMAVCRKPKNKKPED